MKTLSKKIAKALCLAALAVVPLSATAERRWLITSHSQLSTNTTDFVTHGKCDISRIGLTDGDPMKDDALTKEERDKGGKEGERWESLDDTAPEAERNFLQIELNIPLNEILKTDDETLVVFTKRHAQSGHGHPTGFEIRASITGDDWDTAPVIAYAYLIYRGQNNKTRNNNPSENGTKEYSARLDIPSVYKQAPYKYLRFYVTANNTKDRVTDTNGKLTDRRTMKLLSFNIMALGKDDNYSDILVDRFHLLTDFSYKYFNYDFINTLGIFEPRNRKSKVFYGSEQDYDITGYTKWPGEADSPWTDAGDSIYWNKDTEYLDNIGVKMPVYKKLTAKDDIRIATHAKVDGTEIDNWRQPVHEVEHVLYAIPGDPIALYPFYEFADKDVSNLLSRYHSTFIHWYNYRTGGNVKDKDGTRLLDFIVDPSIVCKSDKFGFYSGQYISGYTKYDSTDIGIGDGYETITLAPTAAGTVVEIKTKTENDGSVKKDMIVKINSAAGVKEFQNDYNNSTKYDEATTLHVQLGAIGTPADGVLDFSEITDLAPIGTAEKPFKGTFDGRWCTIRNYNAEGTTTGIFGNISNDAVIQKFYLKNDSKVDGLFDTTTITTNSENKREIETTKSYIDTETGSLTTTSVKTIDGKEASKAENLKISSVDAFIKFQKDYNEWKYDGISLSVELDPAVDYDFSGKEYTPIGNTSKPFTGTFDGKGATLKGISINQPLTANLGIFGEVKGYADIKNLHLSKIKISGSEYIGFIGHTISEDQKLIHVYNVVIDSDVELSGNSYVGGLIGKTDASNGQAIISNVIIAGSVKSHNNNSAMIAPTESAAVVFQNCVSLGSFNVPWSDFLFAYRYNGGSSEDYDNSFAYITKGDNILGDHNAFEDKLKFDKDKGLKLLGKDDNGYYFENPDSDNKVYVNSQNFAQLLGSDWTLKDGMDFPVPFANADSGNDDNPGIKPDPTPEIDQKPNDPGTESMADLDDVPGLRDLENKIYGGKPTYGDLQKFISGNVATFFYPRPTNPDGNGEMTNLPMAPNGTFNDDYLIAADIATVFKDGSKGPDYNIVDSEKKIYEPTILWRHIFRIKDGKKFAEEFSGSIESNREYVKNNRRIISAPGDRHFQVRLDCPIPVEEYDNYPAPSKYYYKISDTDYRRVRSSDIYVFKWNDAIQDFEKTPTDEVTFKSDYSFKGMGSRTFDGTTYNVCGGGGKYNRYLVCEKPKEGRYLARLIGKDINGDKIEIYGSDPGDERKYLILQEFDITFTPHAQGHVDEFADGVAKDKQMNEDFGLPNVKIDYDEYNHLLVKKTEGSLGVENPEDYFITAAEGKQHFKWPYTWDHSSYGFGYSMNPAHDQQAYNYDIYKIANNSGATPWHNAGDDLKDVKYGKSPDDDKQTGFFYYMNSSSDPGVAARLELKDLCPGSKIYVSAYLNEMSGGETANMVFNFSAVGKNKERVVIQSFVTGYINGSGTWNHVYAEFMPDLNKKEYAERVLEGIDHYEIELDNNCKSSEYADYAVDDIKIYVVRPQVFAEQLQPLCEAMLQTPVKIQLPFEPLLASLGYNEVTRNSAQREAAMKSPYFMKEQRANNSQNDHLKVYYCFVDKAKFNKLYHKVGYEQAFDEARLEYRYNLKDENPEQTFGVIEFSNLFTNNTPYPGNPVDVSAALDMKGTVYAEKEDDVRYLTLITVPEKGGGDTFIPGEEYYIALYINDTEGIQPGALEFDILNRCSHTCEFTVESANTTIITNDNGNVTLPDDTYCLGSSPNVEIQLSNIKKPLEDGGFEKLEGGILDWYAGPLTQFDDEKSEKGESLQEALMKLRAVNDQPLDEKQLAAVATGAAFTESMKSMLLSLMGQTYKDGRKKLILGASSCRFPELQASATDSLNYAVAVPVIPIRYQDKDEEEVQYCGAPMELRLKVSANAPGMFHGLQIDYPEEIVDVPVRIGLNQIKAAQENDNTLRIPLVEVSSPTTHSTGVKLRMQRDNSSLIDREVLLIQTDDERYSDIAIMNVPEYGGDSPEAIAEAGDSFERHGIFPIVGKIARLDAQKGTREDYIPGNAFFVQFDKRFEFREGCTYIMKFNIEEDGPAGFKTTACPGQHIFTIKVVPEYLVWNGAGTDLNWNNDDNWSRVAPEDLYPDMKKSELSANGKKISDELLNGFTTGNDADSPLQNSSTRAFAPMEFTKVIIDTTGRQDSEGNEKEGYAFPRLYGIETESVKGMPEAEADPYFPENLKWANLKGADPEAGMPTYNIHYDMAATMRNLDDFGYEEIDGVNVAVAVKPWYANTAEQVHFRAGAEIGSQQWLRYGKAWVEMEMAPERWYLAASPMKQTVAGDMYLPTLGARQVTPLFEEISFDHKADNTGLNNRFAPAVYQRGWDKGTATVYELPSKSNAETRNVAISLDWSHAYNDVKESYDGGTGYSVKTDASQAKDFGKTNDGDKRNDKVLFRFPKADDSYDYWDASGSDSDNKSEGGNLGTRSDRHRLHDTDDVKTVTLTNRGGGSRYFLAGNPFMAHLDMKKFLEANSGKIEPKYWLMTADTQTAAVMGADRTLTANTGTDAAAILAPMQGFFVEASPATRAESTLAISFTPDMTTTATPGSSMLRARREESDGVLRIVPVSADGREGTAAAVRLDATASGDYDAAEDVALLDDPSCEAPRAFTIAGNKATSVNTTDNADGMEIGLIAPEGATTTLVIENTADFAGLLLLDTATGEATPLHDGMTVEAKGNASGRFFLTTSSSTPATELLGLRLSVSGNDVTVTAPNAETGLKVSAFTADGMETAAVECDGEATLSLEKGVYIIVARASDGSTLRRKIII